MTEENEMIEEVVQRKPTKKERINALKAEVEELIKKLKSAEDSRDMYRSRENDKDKEIKDLHALFDAVGIQRKQNPDDSCYSSDLSIMARFAAYLQSMINK